MGIICNLVDIVLFFFFLFTAVAAPLLDPQACLPQHLFPPFMAELMNWYTQFSGDYLFIEKPHFFVGLVWVELFFQWPLAVASLYAIIAGKSWLNTTCLLYGASTLTSLVTVLAEMTRSNRASNTQLKIYFPFLGLTVLALLRGVIAHSEKSKTIGKEPLQQRKRGFEIKLF